MNLCGSKVKEYLELGWTESQIEKGYDFFEATGSTSIIDGAIVVESISDVGLFESDWDACREAEKDGVKFINDVEGLEKGCYVDTPDNREHCINMLKIHSKYNVSNLIKEDGEDSPYWVRYKKYFSL